MLQLHHYIIVWHMFAAIILSMNTRSLIDEHNCVARECVCVCTRYEMMRFRAPLTYTVLYVSLALVTSHS